ncbi:MAG: hypothetical protein FWJ87_14950 [Micromonosporaceae bacterium]
MNAARRYYEARVLVVPHGPSARAAEKEMRDLGLDGVMTVHRVPDDSPDLRLRPVATHGWTRQATVGAIGEAVTGADIVVHLATDLTEVDVTVCNSAADAAQEAGALSAALVVRPDGTGTPAGDTAMAALRTVADMLVIVRGPGLAAAFLDELRGGQRDSA